MLARFIGWLFGRDRREEPRIDPMALDIDRRQRAVARRLAPIVGKAPEELYDYRRADAIFFGGRNHENP